MATTLTWFHVGLVVAIYAVIHAIFATHTLSQFLQQLEEQVPDVWHSLGSPRMGAMTPGAGPRLYAYLRAREYDKLADEQLKKKARSAWGQGIGTLIDIALAATFFVMFFAGVPMPDALASIQVPF
jgi:hypothetical protein